MFQVSIRPESTCTCTYLPAGIVTPVSIQLPVLVTVAVPLSSGCGLGVKVGVEVAVAVAVKVAVAVQGMPKTLYPTDQEPLSISKFRL